MIKCELCSAQFLNNFDGSLTKHLSQHHNLSLRDYVIQTKYNNKPPICKCGLCNDIPKFYRGMFTKYTNGHNKQKWYIAQYIKKYGHPRCITCNKIIGFHRKTPRQYCSFECMGQRNGFSKDSTQKIIKDNIFIKYGVKNISKLDSVRKKLSNSLRGKNLGRTLSKETRDKISIAMKNIWKDNTNRENRLKTYHSTEYMDKRLYFLKNKIKKHSKLHDNISKALDLINYNFKSEQIINNYIVDELNVDKKVIIEINGDYVHANPKKYSAGDIIKVYGNRYTAQEKWDSDKIRTEKLQKLGYKVIIIWESDNLADKKKEITQAIS